jgi:hypothetical protein
VAETTDRKLVRYVGRAYDSARWAGFDPRPEDIIISTPPKCGTTWTQMICALLILQTPELPDRLSNLSPWLDTLTRSRKEVVALLDAQAHRRFVKTHTPLPGIPLREGVTYICIGRDPRDVALSRDDHLANMDWDAFHVQRVAAAREDGLPEPEKITPPPLDQFTDRDRFWRWVDEDAPPEAASAGMLRMLRHIESFRDVARHGERRAAPLPRTQDRPGRPDARASSTTGHRRARRAMACPRRSRHLRVDAARQRPHRAQHGHLEGAARLLQARSQRRMA